MRYMTPILIIANVAAISVGCGEKLPKIVPNPQIHYDEPRDDIEWKSWKAADNLAKRNELIRSASVAVIDANGTSVEEVMPNRFTIRSSSEYRIEVRFKTDPDVTSLPPTTNSISVIPENGSKATPVFHDFTTVSNKGGCDFVLAAQVKNIPVGTHWAILELGLSEAFRVILDVRAKD